jgi:hypothetical protein
VSGQWRESTTVGAAGPRGIRLHSDPDETGLSESERIEKRVDHSNRIILVDPVVQTLKKQRRLSAIRPLNETLHSIPATPVDYTHLN